MEAINILQLARCPTLNHLWEAMVLTRTSRTPQQVSTAVRQNLLTSSTWEDLCSPRQRNKHSKFTMGKVELQLKAQLCSTHTTEAVATPLEGIPTCTSS